MANDNMHWLQYLANPHGFAIKKYLYEILGSRYQKNDIFIERLCAILSTKDDVEKFGTLMRDLFESGFHKAIERYRVQLEKLGYDITITHESPKKTENIFPDQSEKSG
jgi:hypothetical protein